MPKMIEKYESVIRANQEFEATTTNAQDRESCKKQTALIQSIVDALRANDETRLKEAQEKLESWNKVYKTGKILGN